MPEIGILQTLLGALAGLVRWAVGFLPDSPVKTFLETWSPGGVVDKGLGWLNWIVPFGDILALFGLWLVAAVVFVAYKMIKRRALNNVIGAVTGGGDA